jgi:hypothetical protein
LRFGADFAEVKAASLAIASSSFTAGETSGLIPSFSSIAALRSSTVFGAGLEANCALTANNSKFTISPRALRVVRDIFLISKKRLYRYSIYAFQ